MGFGVATWNETSLPLLTLLVSYLRYHPVHSFTHLQTSVMLWFIAFSLRRPLPIRIPQQHYRGVFYRQYCQESRGSLPSDPMQVHLWSYGLHSNLLWACTRHVTKFAIVHLLHSNTPVCTHVHMHTHVQLPMESGLSTWGVSSQQRPSPITSACPQWVRCMIFPL